MAISRKISVIGLGYVGLPVAVAFGKSHQVVGFDINTKRIAELKEGIDLTKEVTGEDLKSADILFSHQIEDLKKADFHIVAVPTPVNQAKQPDLTPLIKASETVGQALKKGDIVVYESTVYPGATEEDCIPVLERVSGLKSPEDFTVGYSPERINPGDKEHNFTNILKIVSGQTPATLDIVAEVYESVVTAGIYRAPTLKVAEAAKVIENTQRDLNIALINELAVIFNKMDINTLDVLEAAGTKWNFLPFRPGLVGGHCISVDPYYLTHKAQKLGYNPQVILAGRNVNDQMGSFIAQKTIKEIIHNNHNVQGAVVTIMGITFKEDCPDLRNSGVVDIIYELQEFGVQVQIYDPVADPEETHQEYGLTLTPWNQLKPAQAVIFAVAHQAFKAMGDQELDAITVKPFALLDVKAVTKGRKFNLPHRLWNL